MLLENNVFIGVGQFGNYMARELEKLNYKVFYINSAKEDLDRVGALSLDITHLIKGAKGFKKDREFAKNYVLESESINTIIEQINNEYANESVYNFIFSTGGGTGSGITPTLIRFMRDWSEYKTINIITVTPHELDITIDGNSALCLDEIHSLVEDGVVNSMHILSNENFADNVGRVNNIFASTLDRYNEITSEIDLVDDESEVTIRGSEGDTGEFTELLNSDGVTVMMELEHEDTEEDFERALKEGVENTIYAPWIKDCENLGFYTTKVNQNQHNIDLVTAEFGIPMKTHTGITQSGTFIIATGMSWNENIENKMAQQSAELEKRRNEQIERQKAELAKSNSEKVDINALKERLNKNSAVNSNKRSMPANPRNRSTVRERKSGKQKFEETLARLKEQGKIK